MLIEPTTKKISSTSCDNKLTNLQGDLVDESDGGDRICDRVEAERKKSFFALPHFIFLSLSFQRSNVAAAS